MNGVFPTSPSSSAKRKTTSRKTTTTKRPTSSSGAGPTIWTIVIALLFLLRLGVAAERCGRSNNSSSYDYSLNRTQEQKFEEIMRQLRAKERRRIQELPQVEEGIEEVDRSPSLVVSPSTNSSRQARSTKAKEAAIEEVPKEKEAPKIVRREFKQSDLFGSWVTFRVTDEDAKINYKYNIINPTQGERVITYSDKEKDVRYSVKQPFIYKLTVDKWNTGRIYMTMQTVKPINCTKIEADTCNYSGSI